MLDVQMHCFRIPMVRCSVHDRGGIQLVVEKKSFTIGIYTQHILLDLVCCTWNSPETDFAHHTVERTFTPHEVRYETDAESFSSGNKFLRHCGEACLTCFFTIHVMVAVPLGPSQTSAT